MNKTINLPIPEGVYWATIIKRPKVWTSYYNGLPLVNFKWHIPKFSRYINESFLPGSPDLIKMARYVGLAGRTVDEDDLTMLKGLEAMIEITHRHYYKEEVFYRVEISEILWSPNK